jgi:hypothetical protein
VYLEECQAAIIRDGHRPLGSIPKAISLDANDAAEHLNGYAFRYSYAEEFMAVLVTEVQKINWRPPLTWGGGVSESQPRCSN